MGTVNELLTITRKQLSVREDPPNSNNVRYNTWYYGREVSGSAYPWCAVFVQWCFAQASVKLPKRTASCGDLMRAAKAAGCWVTADFLPGDVVIYDFSGKRQTTEHCGVVEVVLPGCGVQALEGNTSQSGSQSNGGQVCRKNRADKYIIGAVRPQFEPEMKKEDKPMAAEKRYNTVAECPAWAQDTVRKLVRHGSLGGSTGKKDSQGLPTGLDLSGDMLRVFVTMDREGACGK